VRMGVIIVVDETRGRVGNMVDCRSLITAVCLAAVFDPNRFGPVVTLPEDTQRQMVWCTVLVDRMKKGQPKLCLEVERGGSMCVDGEDTYRFW
jgi:hypothetical protein